MPDPDVSLQELGIFSQGRYGYGIHHFPIFHERHTVSYRQDCIHAYVTDLHHPVWPAR